MYATVVWNIDPNSVNARQIEQRVQQLIGAQPSAPLWRNAAITAVAGSDALAELGRALEVVHRDFPAEFDYLCVGSAAGGRLAPPSRPSWNMQVIQRIIT